MFERDKYVIWEAGEVIYRAGDPSNEAFLIMEGSVQIFTSEGLLLNRIGTNEILGETSLLLNVSRTVTAIAALTGAKATRIPRQYFQDIATRDRVTGALIRKSQYRLIDSNTQSNMLGTEIERLSVLLENAIKNGFSDNTAIEELRTTIARLRKQVVFDKHHAYHPSTMEGSRDDGENADNFGFFCLISAACRWCAQLCVVCQPGTAPQAQRQHPLIPHGHGMRLARAVEFDAAGPRKARLIETSTRSIFFSA